MLVRTKHYHDFDNEIENHHDQTEHVAAVVGEIVVEPNALVDAHLDEIKKERHGDQQDEIKDRATLVQVGDGDPEGRKNWIVDGTGKPHQTKRRHHAQEQ
jgi:hypothetical protein